MLYEVITHKIKEIEIEDVRPGDEIELRITSYNVCYTKLLRADAADGRATGTAQ